MAKYKFVVLVFLFILMGTAIASMLGVNVQSIYRVPGIYVKWIDIAILAIIFIYLIQLQFNEKRFSNNDFIIPLCYVYLLFAFFQLAKSWGDYDKNSQISHFLCTLSIFIIIDLSTFKIDPEKIIQNIKKIAILSSFALIVSFFFTLYSFHLGNTKLTDSDIRVALDVAGEKESVYELVLVAFVYISALYFALNKSKSWEKVVFISAILSIYASVIYSFGRGYLFTLFLISVIYVFVFSKKVVKSVIQILNMLLIIGVFYLLFGNILRQNGYDPAERITEIINFTVDVDNPEWDKGRSVSRSYAIDAWKEKMWLGYGYNELYNHGLPTDTASAHNFIITSLFHFGIIGTFIYALILLLLYRNSIKLWKILKKEDNYQNDIMKLLVISSFFWIIIAWTQEAFWEKHSLVLQFVFLGLISNYYKQLIAIKATNLIRFRKN